MSNTVVRHHESVEQIYATIWAPPGNQLGGAEISIVCRPRDGGPDLVMAATVVGLTGPRTIVKTSQVTLAAGTYDVYVRIDKGSAVPFLEAGQIVSQ